jgi:8-oxo-dGTP pyrophosphatase MutT (NUDIX family)
MTNNVSNKYVGAGIILMARSPCLGEDRFLLLKGLDSGVWSFPKGHPEAMDGGMPLCTAVRETREETGLVAGVDYDILSESIRFGKRPYWIGVVRPTMGRIQLACDEHSMAAWFTWSEIANLEACNTDVRCWIKKSRGPNGVFVRLTSLIDSLLSLPSAAQETIDTHSTCEGHSGS